MEQEEILKRLGEIVTKHTPLLIAPASNTCTCWFDGDKCPYGFPNGRFRDRPEQICHLGNGGCYRLTTLKENVDDFFGDSYEEQASEKLDNAVEKNKVSLSSELKVIAEECEDESPEQQMLELAADIIRNQHDKDILRIADIENI